MSKRGQFSLELFVVLTFFVLVLLWLNNYYQDLRSQDLLFSQQNNLLEQISLLQGEAFISNQTLYFGLPCLVSEGKGTPFWVYGGKVNQDGSVVEGANETTLAAVVYATRQSIGTAFPVNATPNPLVFECSDGKAGKIVFSREKVIQPGGPAIDGIMLRKG